MNTGAAMKLTLTASLIGLLSALPLAAPAQSGSPHTHGAPVSSAAKSTELYDGQVRRINRETNRVTLAHGPLKGLDMPAMTMAFPVKDAKLLASIKEGDKVKFTLEPLGDNLVVTRIDVVK
jgi:Cu/Ag efflux protein CusF